MKESETRNVLGPVIKDLRTSKHLTQVDLSKLTGFKQNTISQHENQKRELGESDIYIYAEALGVTPQFLFNKQKFDSTLDRLTSIFSQLKEPRQNKVITFSQHQLDQQNGIVKETRPIYLVGQTAAGEPIEYNQIPADQITAEVPDGADYALMVNGDSMEPLIKNGSIIFYKAQPTVENGELAIVEIEGNSVTCKKFYYDGEKAILKSINSKYKDIVLESGVRVLGKVIL